MGIKSSIVAFVVAGLLGGGAYWGWTITEKQRSDIVLQKAYEIRVKERDRQNELINQQNQVAKAAQDKAAAEQKKADDERKKQEDEARRLKDEERAAQINLEQRQADIRKVRDEISYASISLVRAHQRLMQVPLTPLPNGMTTSLLGMEALRELDRICETLPHEANNDVIKKDLREAIVVGAAMINERSYMDEMLKRLPDSKQFELMITGKCPICGGTAKIKCRTCNGSGNCSNKCDNGKIKQMTGLSSSESKSCPICLGTGRCAVCNGHKEIDCTNTACRNGRVIYYAKCQPFFEKSIDQVIAALNKLISGESSN